MEQLDNIQDLIHVIRGQRVMLDFDLARLYHVETKTLNQAVKRNAKRFEGEEFMFQLTKEEWREVKVKITNINIVDNQDITTLRSQNVTARQVQKQRFQPYAFTEIGVAMRSSVLRSEVAIYANRKILANHVAELYGVETREVNQAIKNNPNKFPNGYILELDKKEKDEVIKIFDNLGNLLYSPAPLKAFTEKGLYMLATILKSPKAVETTIAIVEAYAKLRELTRVMSEIPQHEGDKAQQESLLKRGGQLVDDLLNDVMPVQSSETTLELNLAMLKLKHTVRREKPENT